MGLTGSSTGKKAVDCGLVINRQTAKDKVIALAGNPNVGKSTVFNAITGMNQHTGNWSGKTVANAMGRYETENYNYILVDIPGTYSLMANSAEEEVARNFVCYGNVDAVAVVCDATCIERNLGLVLQIIETGVTVIVCINLLDEAKRKGIKLDIEKLSKRLGVTVVGIVARRKKSLNAFIEALDNVFLENKSESSFLVRYTPEIEQAIAMVEPSVKNAVDGKLNSRWLSIKLLDFDEKLSEQTEKYLNFNILKDEAVADAVYKANDFLSRQAIGSEEIKEIIATKTVKTAEKICSGAVEYKKTDYSAFDRRLDKMLTGKIIGYPVMILLLLLIFWLTIVGANYPSELLSDFLFSGKDALRWLLNVIHSPMWIQDLIIDGMYTVLAWVVSVMLPPMAIFFPLFTLLEDMGYLPRIAYNLDKPFHKCNSCGKQALTMCMGFGCNAAGVVGCRIIDSPRERLLAVLTNSFVPCNGRFPAIISIISMFFVGTVSGLFSSFLSTLLLTAVILLGIAMTFISTKFLSKTLLKGMSSSFVLELPPYRCPQIGKVLLRSVFDRTLFVLGRAVSIAAPAGIIIWIMANITVDGNTLLYLSSSLLDPIGKALGLDGVILMAFILGFPANEIVVPITIMAYTAGNSLIEYDSLWQLKDLLIANGWTAVTAICFIVFSLMHWPCSTTLMTVKKETGSFKWTVVAALLPTVFGVALCVLINMMSKIF